MPKATPTQLLILLAIFVVGTTTSTLLAWHSPDSNSQAYVGIVTVAALLVATFLLNRKKAT